MERIRKIFGSIWGKILLVVLLIVLAFFVRSGLEQKQEKSEQGQEKTATRDIVYADPVEEAHPLLQVFFREFPDTEVILACEEDVTDDGLKDLVVIYRQEDMTRMVVAVDGGDGKNYHFSDPIKAPVENQKIQFKNIDKEGEIEFIITGEKKGAVGYAIYRMMDGQPVDLFGEGMEDCC